MSPMLSALPASTYEEREHLLIEKVATRAAKAMELPPEPRQSFDARPMLVTVMVATLLAVFAKAWASAANVRRAHVDSKLSTDEPVDIGHPVLRATPQLTTMPRR